MIQMTNKPIDEELKARAHVNRDEVIVDEKERHVCLQYLQFLDKRPIIPKQFFCGK
jgi:hypothetical protein